LTACRGDFAQNSAPINKSFKSRFANRNWRKVSENRSCEVKRWLNGSEEALVSGA
jgi:hypothetical protein